MKNSNLIKIHSDENNLSKEQKLFNQLSKQIERKKKELGKWEKYAEEYRQKHAKYFFPLENEFYECRKKWSSYLIQDWEIQILIMEKKES